MKFISWPTPLERQTVSSPWYFTLAKQLTLAVVLWLTHFFHSSQFGLYEDDWNRVPRIIGLDWHGIWTLLRANLFTVSGQGRPLHGGFVFFFSYIGFRFGQLPGIYVVAFFVLLTSTLLFQSFLNKVFRDERFAFLGALAFSIFPADTTQPFLTHALGLQSAIILLLIAFHLYLSGWKINSYLFIALILVNYETPYFVFAAAPLLVPRSKYELLRHWAIMFVILVCIAVARTMSADARVSHMGKKDLMLGSLNIISGPLTSLSMYVYRPVTALIHLRGLDAVVVTACAVGLAGVLAALYLQKLRPGAEINAEISLEQTGSTDSRRQLMIGFLLLLLAYPLTLTTAGIAVAGRGTRAHSAAILGASILCAWACSRILLRPSGRAGRRAAVIGIACFYALLVGFGLTVQHDYVLAWQEERGFWTDLVALCPSLQDGDVIFVEPTGLRDTRQLLFLRKDLTGVPDTRQIKSLDEVYRILPYLYAFPAEWQNPPRVFRLPLNWESKIFAGGDKLNPLTIEEGYAYEPGTLPPIDASHAIFLDTNGGRLTRRSSLVNPKDGESLALKTDSSSSNKNIEAPVYPYVIYPEGHAIAPYLAK